MIDRQKALVAIHTYQKAVEASQSFMDTAAIIHSRMPEAEAENISQRAIAKQIAEAHIIVRNLDDKNVENARNPTEAYKKALAREAAEYKAQLAKIMEERRPKTEAPKVELWEGDMFDLLPKIEDGVFDLILADPPYGQGADNASYASRTGHHHDYDDTPDYALKCAIAILEHGFRVTKPGANLFMFCQIDLFVLLKQAAQRLTWVPWENPIIWQKSHSEGIAPWQAKGPRRTFEMIFYATKGRRGLLASPVDILDFKRVPRNSRHGAPEKPIELIRYLIETSTLPQDRVLDPVCGYGTTLRAALDTNRQALGIERNPNTATVARSRMLDENAMQELQATTGDDTDADLDMESTTNDTEIDDFA